MTALALRGNANPERGQAHRDASRGKLAQSVTGLCPDELAVYAAIRAAGQYISPSRLHAMYLAVTANADADFDFGSSVLTYMSKRRHASVPVDMAVGERATRQLMKELT